MYSPALDDVLIQYAYVFKSELGRFNVSEVSIPVDESTHPRFYKARPLPYALRERVDQEIDCLIHLEVMSPVKQSRWAAPVVLVQQNYHSIRLCGDYNQAPKPDPYPIPRIDDLYGTLSGGKSFAKLDMSQAYQQFVLDQISRQYTLNTHKGFCE